MTCRNITLKCRTQRPVVPLYVCKNLTASICRFARVACYRHSSWIEKLSCYSVSASAQPRFIGSQVKSHDGRVRVDACVNFANTLASWADVESVQDMGSGRASELLVAAVEGYKRALEQEEDAAVSALQYILSMQDLHIYDAHASVTQRLL